MTATLLGLILGLLAGLLLDDGFTPHRSWFDLRHPGHFVVDQGAIAPSPLAYFQWHGRVPLKLALGELRPGDHLTLKVRTDGMSTPVTVEIGDGAARAFLVTAAWRELDVPVDFGGSLVTLREPSVASVPVHFARISYSNLRGALEGPAPIWFTDGRAPRVTSPSLLEVAGLGLLGTLLSLAWSRRGDPRRLIPALGPIALVMATLASLWQLGGSRPHVSTSAFVALMLLPSMVMLLLRGGGRLRRMLANALSTETLSGHGTAGWLATPLLPESAGRGTWRHPLALHLAFTAVGLAVVAAVVVQDFGAPMLGDGDLDQWTLQASYVARNLSLYPIPRLDLVNDQLFYPYGGDNVYQPWVLEMHVATALGSRLVPSWGWLQLYFLFSLAVTAIGAYFLLSPEVGPRRASVGGLALAFLNFYALGKYPGHLGVACVHWMTLNLLADFVAARRVVRGRPLTARFLALRALLLVLVLGQDLSYVAGVALTCFLLTSSYLAVLVMVRAGASGSALSRWLSWQWSEIVGSLREHPLQVGALVVATAAAAWLWVPLVLDIAHASALYDFSNVPSGSWWANPLRLLAPVLPGVAGWLRRTLGDTPEGLFAASPGLLFVLPAAAGLLAADRRRRMELTPFVLLLILFLSFHPVRLPMLKLLPWFAFARVSGRFSIAYPVLLGVLALSLPRQVFGRPFTRLLALALIVLASGEALTAYHACSWTKERSVTDRGFLRFVETVRRAPGEAVLDWPFCLVGGNGVGGDGTGAFYGRLAGISVLQAFHGKKIVGKYFGRLHPDQLRPYLAAGWNRMFMPDSLDSHRARRQRRDFSAQQWSFFEDFFADNDFCGIILYTELLPPATLAGFHRRFGPPTARYDGLPWGPMEFIPRPASWRHRLSPAPGRPVMLGDYPVPWKPGTRVTAAAGTLTDYLGPGWVRDHTEGRTAEIRFALDKAEPLVLTAKLRTFGHQRVMATLNGTLLDTLRLAGGTHVISIVLPEIRLRHDDRLRFDLPDARSPAESGLGADRRVLALTVEWMRLGRHPAPVLPIGEILRPDSEFADEYFRRGWSEPSLGARTIVRSPAEILFAVREVCPLLLVMSVSSARDRRMGLEINGRQLTPVRTPGGGVKTVEVSIPAATVALDNRLTLHVPNPGPSARHGGGGVGSSGVTLHWLRLEANPEPHRE